MRPNYARFSVVLLVLAALVVVIVLRRPEQARQGIAPGRIKIGIVFDIGGKDDHSFNSAAWEGVRKAGKDFDVTVRDVEPGNPTSIEPAIRAFAERGYDLIIGIGFAQGPILESVARDYPQLNFAIVDGVIDLPNVASLVFKEHEGSYLVGMIAARKSQSGVLGFVGGMDIPLIHRFETGFEEGARSVQPDIRIVQNYVGITDAAWNNPGKGKELALSQIDRGADVIFTAAGSSGLGVFDAVEQAGKDQNGQATHFVIGVDSNQNWLKPGFVLTSMVKRVDNAVYQTVADVVQKRFKGGFHVFGLETDGVAYARDGFNEALLPPSVIDEVEAARKRIISGEIKVTDAMAK